jgi:phage gpG-like protein
VAFEIFISGRANIDRAARGLLSAKGRIRVMLRQATDDFGNAAVRNIREHYLTGPRPGKLGVKSGRLRSSIRFKVKEDDKGLAVQIGTDVPYAAIHEFGGKTNPHVISPKRKPFLAFQKDGKWIYTRKPVNHPGSKIPARPFIVPGATEVMPAFQARCMDILAKVAREGIGGQ